MQTKNRPDQSRKPRRYLRSLITRKLILDTAMQIFLTEGYTKTTITKISTNATVGYGTIYSHFKGKDDLLKKLIDRLLEEFYHLLETPFEPGTYTETRTYFCKLIESYFLLAAQHRQIMRVYREALGESSELFDHWHAIKMRLTATISRFITACRKRGLTQTVHPEKAAGASVLLLECFLWEVVREEIKDVQSLAAFLTGMVFEGFFIKPAQVKLTLGNRNRS